MPLGGERKERWQSGEETALERGIAFGSPPIPVVPAGGI